MQFLDEIKGINFCQSKEAEAAVLGSMMLSPPCIPSVDENVGSDMFSQHKNHLIYDAILSTYDKHGNAFDVVLLRDELRTAGDLDEIGDAEYLRELLESVPSAANVEYYSKIIIDKYHHRQIMEAAIKMAEASFTTDSIAKKLALIDNLRAGLESTADDEMVGVNEALVSGYNAFIQKTATKTGFESIDSMIVGMKPGNMIVIAGRPGMGKTALSLNVATNVAKEHEVLFFSLEMNKAELGQRLLRTSSGITSREPSNAEMDEMISVMPTYSDYKMNIITTGYLTPNKLKSKCKAIQRAKSISLVVVDYLGLMKPNTRHKSLYEATTSISRDIKLVAGELGVPIIIICQLNRSMMDRKDNRPRISDLRDSGAIEQDADVILLIHREDEFRKNDTGYVKNGEANILIDKNRHGATGVAKLLWRPGTTTFTDYYG